MSVLATIRSNEFFDRVDHGLPAEILFPVIQRTPEFREFQEAYKSGAITDADIEAYATELLGSFRRGERFGFEVVLSFLAISLCRVRTKFVHQFLSDLARVNVAEFQTAPRVARQCLELRKKMTHSESRSFVIRQVVPDSLVYVPRSRAARPRRQAAYQIAL